MATKLTSKGQVTVPKRVREALQLSPGCSVDFAVNHEGNVVITRSDRRTPIKKNGRFDAVRGRADVRWRTDELMALLRGGD